MVSQSRDVEQAFGWLGSPFTYDAAFSEHYPPRAEVGADSAGNETGGAASWTAKCELVTYPPLSDYPPVLTPPALTPPGPPSPPLPQPDRAVDIANEPTRIIPRIVEPPVEDHAATTLRAQQELQRRSSALLADAERALFASHEEAARLMQQAGQESARLLAAAEETAAARVARANQQLAQAQIAAHQLREEAAAELAAAHQQAAQRSHSAQAEAEAIVAAAQAAAERLRGEAARETATN